MNISMRIRFLLCLPLFAIPARLAAEGPAGGAFRVLFDRAHGEVRAGEPGSSDADDPRPLSERSPEAATGQAPPSRLALRLYRTGRYESVAVPRGDSLTWLDGENVRDLSLFDLLVICEPHEPFPREEAAAIRAFVTSGRSLLVIGRGGREDAAVVEALNDLLAAVLDDGTGGEVRFRLADRPSGRPFQSGRGSSRDPVLDGPFGSVRSLPAGRPMEIAWRDLGADTRSGPAPGGGEPLYLLVSRGDGAIGVVPDGELLEAEDTSDGSGAGTTFFLNLIALLVDDHYPPATPGWMRVRKEPAAELVTDRGATITFGTDRPCWGLLEFTAGSAPRMAFRSLRTEQSIRVRGLDPDREYRVSLRLYDGWGRGPLRTDPFLFRTAPARAPEFGDVTISEVFWGAEDPYIELFNTLDRPVDLEGWSIMDDETRWFLGGVVAPRAFHLLTTSEGGMGGGEGRERLPEAIHLDPAGDFLILEDDDGDVISTANLAGGRWPAGGEGASMERVDLAGPDEPDNWDTAVIRGDGFQGTPGAPNSRKRIEMTVPVLDAVVAEGGIRLSWEMDDVDSAATVSLYRSIVSPGRTTPAEYIRLDGPPIPAGSGSYLDVGAPPGVSVQYLLGVSGRDGTERFSDPVRLRSASQTLPVGVDVTMDQNYPNPFNPRTEIRYVIGEPQEGAPDFPLRASLSIFDIRGRQIRVLEERDVRPGEHVVSWDGRDDNGEPVSSGSYYYRLTITRPESREILLQLSRKMVLMR